MLEIFRIILSLILILFIPGFTLIQALFPKKNQISSQDDWLYRIVLSCAMSVVISIVIAFIISLFGMSKTTGKGYFIPEIIVPSLLVISVVFLIVGIYRGAYPKLFTIKEERVVLSVTAERKKELILKMKRYRKIKDEMKIIKSNLEDNPSYKAKMRFNKQLKEKQAEIDILEKDLKLQS